MPISWQSLPHHLAPLILCPAALMLFTPIFRTSYLEESKGLVVLLLMIMHFSYTPCLVQGLCTFFRLCCRATSSSHRAFDTQSTHSKSSIVSTLLLFKILMHDVQDQRHTLNQFFVLRQITSPTFFCRCGVRKIPQARGHRILEGQTVVHTIMVTIVCQSYKSDNKIGLISDESNLNLSAPNSQILLHLLGGGRWRLLQPRDGTSGRSDLLQYTPKKGF